MKKNFCLVAGLLAVSSLVPVFSQKLVPNNKVTGVCYAGSKTKRIYIPPPDAFYRKSSPEGRASVTILYSGFTASAKNAVEYAATILETILPAGTNVVVAASWERITSSGVLASSGTTGFAAGWTIDALNPLALYPVALAEKIAGEALNDSLEPDISLTINNGINWYLGTDGNTAGNQYDLVTVVLHEICHGLGFFDSMNTNSSIGWFGLRGFPFIYDTFIQNAGGTRLTDTLAIPNFSGAMRTELIGGNLFIKGPLLSNFTGGVTPRIYSPAIWDGGSSVSHLDELSTTQENQLMTPFIDRGEAIHDPGQLTLSILGDLGWVNTHIIPVDRHDTETRLNDLPLAVRIASDTLYDHEKVAVVYSFDRFVSSDTLFMTSPGSDNSYISSIGLPSYNTEVQYYFFAIDCFNRIYRSPSLIDSLKYKVYIGTDTIGPVITHTPLKSFLEKVDTIKFDATATDNLGMDTVFVEYILNDGQPAFLGLKAGTKDSYSGVLNAKSLFLNGGDSIQYRIVARDTARVFNTSFLPDSGYYTIQIEDISSVLESYATDFTGDAANDFFNDGFEILKPSGLTSFGLNSKHPYESTEDNARTINYISILRHPFKFNESGLVINFREIVLVEPGESGSVYGSEAFYDYVVVEGSKNFGKTWFSLADGYDSRYLRTWETAYNSSSDGTNSTASGKESLLNKHTIYYTPSDKISAGDTILIRFRLFSDPAAHGWGWVVEDLKINPLIDAVEKVNTDATVKVYPNPGNGMIRMSIADEGSGSGKPVRYAVFNASGFSLSTGYLSGDAENVIDISDRPAGMYIIVLYWGDWIKTIKYSLIK